ncbi:PREDICTED: putative tripartite motif-containing protein 75 [Ceratotherium simum simum]|uniref:Tripartite motif-containing protein 75 n=1 Tax=Ceratotherium simum simum TaxID=73337 RepID=A0ABM0HTA0_CERSS|nr:PREDICTED: putative tripartite motif-containing protein 75 [Ceratotherium simum simum]
MAFAASLADLQAEASCPICLDYLRDPVTIHCGHNFCLLCIHQCWEDLQDIFPCPICLHHCPDRSFKKNPQLGHLTEIVKQLPTTSSKRKGQEEKPLCEKHNQVLALFCEEDLELLCPQCRVSSDHRDHPLTPTEQAAASHRRKLRSYIKPLRKQIEDAELGREIQVSKSLTEVQWKMKKWRRELCSEFEELNDFLRKEQVAIHGRLLMQEKDVEEKLTQYISQISNHTSRLQNLLSEITEKCSQGDLEFLTGIESIHNRYEHLKCPAVFSYELKKESCNFPPHYFGLQNMMSTFQVDLTLDPETAHPNLIISKDRKSVIYRTTEANCLDHHEAFTYYPAVLSCEGFDAGRHFWQVELRGTGEWSLGVCKNFRSNAHIPPRPKDGWGQFQRCTRTWGTQHTGQAVRIGVFLDYELGEVSYYNWNSRSYLYTLTDTFTGKLMPYFSIGPSSKSLTISMVLDER